MVPSGGGASAPPSTTPAPTTPASPAAAVAPMPGSADPTGQLDLFAWKPRATKPLPPPGTQLDLF
jgi:hypothetical protein